MLGQCVHRSWHLHRIPTVPVLMINHPLSDFRQNVKQIMTMMMFSDDFNKSLIENENNIGKLKCRVRTLCDTSLMLILGVRISLPSVFCI